MLPPPCRMTCGSWQPVLLTLMHIPRTSVMSGNKQHYRCAFHTLVCMALPHASLRQSATLTAVRRRPQRACSAAAQLDMLFIQNLKRL